MKKQHRKEKMNSVKRVNKIRKSMCKKIYVGILLAVVFAGTVLMAGCDQSNGQESIQESNQGSDQSELPQVPAMTDNQAALEQTCQFLYDTITEPAYGTVGGDWTLLNMKQAGFETGADYDACYIETIEAVLTENAGVLDERKYTEYSRVILSLTAMGEDVTDVSGYNLLSYLSDFDAVCKQGISGPIWALIAMDCGDYEFPEIADVQTVTTRELLISYLMDAQISTGGWGYWDDTMDVDVTAMALVALCPYMEEDEAVKAAVDKAIVALSEAQQADGSFKNYEKPTAESCAQVLIALSTLGIDGDTDERFIKNGVSVYDALMTYSCGDGSFCHILGEGTDLIATDQVCSGLIAYEKFLNGEAAIYDMTP